MTDQSEKLSDLEAAFVGAFVETRGRNATQAVIAAGYSPTGAAVQAHKLLKRPRVLAAIREAAERLLKGGVVLAVNVLLDLAQNSTSDAVRRQAAKDLLEHAGMAAITRSEHVVRVTDQRTDKELREHVARLARELGLEGKVIDGTLADSLPALAAIDVEPNEAGEALDPFS